MRHILKSITVILLVFNFTHLRAQTDTINFTINSDTVQTAGQDIAIVSTITKSENALVWTQNNSENTEITNFIISGTSGNWDQNTSIGSVTYTMEIEDYQSELTLLGDTSGITAILRVIISESQEELYTFNIDTISYQ